MNLEPRRNKYVGHRYVPKIFGEWKRENSYEGLSIVTFEGGSYTSKKHVPAGVDIKNDEYWVLTGNYNAQIEYYRKETEKVSKDLDEYEKGNDLIVTAIRKDLDKNMKRTQITPDDFTGTDAEKIQKAIYFAGDNNISVIALTRTYDITGTSIIIDRDPFYVNITLTGGAIVKQDAGYIFNSNKDNSRRNAPLFIGTNFSGSKTQSTVIFNGDKFIRQNCTNCNFMNISLVHTNSHLQSVRLINNETRQHFSDFIKGDNAYDIQIIGHRGEESSITDASFLNLVTKRAGEVSYIGLSITDSLFEGYINSPVFTLGAGYNLNLDGTYFEANKTDINIVKGVGTALVTGKIDGNIFNNVKGEYHITVETSVNINNLIINNNTMTDINNKFMINRKLGYLSDPATNRMTGNGKLHSFTSNKINNNKSYNVTQVDNNGAPQFEIFIPLKSKGTLTSSENTQYLLNSEFTFGSSVAYRGHLTGIMAIDIHVVDGILQRVLNIDVISSRNTSGITNGLLTNSVNYDYFFKDTGTKNISKNGSIDNVVDGVTIVLSLPNAKYNARNKTTVKSLGEMLQSYEENY